MMKKNNFKRGFTLLELLVVISIVGILVAMGAVAFTTAQKKSRDARRKSDVKAVSDALEQYYAENTVYPTGNGWQNGGGCPGLDEYLPGGLPLDPKTKVPTWCDSYATIYCVEAYLEYPGTGNCNNCTIVGSGGDSFCIRNQQ